MISWFTAYIVAVGVFLAIARFSSDISQKEEVTQKQPKNEMSKHSLWQTASEEFEDQRQVQRFE